MSFDREPPPVKEKMIFADAEPRPANGELRGEEKARADWRRLVDRFDSWTGRKE